MSNVSLSSLSDLRSTLIRRGLPVRYADRVTSELHDHAEDIAARPDGTENELGDFSRLADELTHTFRRRTFAGRHPWLMFVLLPLPLAVLAYIGTLMGYFGSIMLIAKTFGLPPTFPYGTVAAIVRVVAVALPTASMAAVTWCVCRVARRAGHRWTHIGFACVPILLVTAYTFCGYRPDSSGQSDGLFVFGFYIPYLMGNSLIGFLGWQQLLQTLVPLLVIGLLMAHEVRKRQMSLAIETA